ncbi:uncharacterized protein M421DRAFT_392198 [Didymella exigua CBS 183.55]|uniref:Uncharacterized protein n=1 Tax=Didymella exigua CBS 183.55 TaxID=1150837 RepID=A0A6A5RJ52_9PLEO|nr:uncharacterized protein M421DRAFT_392198 [Didymella exigua CBS 183.55]KAF1928411.1 hypothetical protein M421DRAFT_392198 [Didymella exigua CBS 183.55]
MVRLYFLFHRLQFFCMFAYRSRPMTVTAVVMATAVTHDVGQSINVNIAAYPDLVPAQLDMAAVPVHQQLEQRAAAVEPQRATPAKRQQSARGRISVGKYKLKQRRRSANDSYPGLTGRELEDVERTYHWVMRGKHHASHRSVFWTGKKMDVALAHQLMVTMNPALCKEHEQVPVGMPQQVNNQQDFGSGYHSSFPLQQQAFMPAQQLPFGAGHGAKSLSGHSQQFNTAANPLPGLGFQHPFPQHQQAYVPAHQAPFGMLGHAEFAQGQGMSDPAPHHQGLQAPQPTCQGFFGTVASAEDLGQAQQFNIAAYAAGDPFGLAQQHNTAAYVIEDLPGPTQQLNNAAYAAEDLPWDLLSTSASPSDLVMGGGWSSAESSRRTSNTSLASMPGAAGGKMAIKLDLFDSYEMQSLRALLPAGGEDLSAEVSSEEGVVAVEDDFSWCLED